MESKKKQSEKDRLDRIIAEARRKREQGYREQALKIFPWVCARCGREFSGKKLRELTVHHKDHNHDNNPPDGSNWELMCLYCHDNEHSRHLDQEWYEDETPGGEEETPSKYKPFADLASLLKDKK
ncbi:MAG: HNH nuclease family protein [Deltaproteobacteria bacterium]|nr:MAG: HNH nuclease family protein [Deltaproteobacteria bacterium]